MGRRIVVWAQSAVGLTAAMLVAAGAATPASAAEDIGTPPCRVTLLTPADASEIPSRYRAVVVEPLEKHRLVVAEALKRMSPLLCAAVRRVVFVNDMRYAAEDGWVLPEQAELVFVNYDPTRRGFGAYPVVKAMQSLLHESTHAADYLLQAHKASTGPLESLLAETYFDKGESTKARWPEASHRVAGAVVKSNRLGGGFRAEWVRLHETFQAQGLAGAYRGAEATQLQGARVATQGFMSPYGASTPGEDIAEFASWIMAAPLFEQTWAGQAVPKTEKPADYACQAMRSHRGDGVPGTLAAAFTKASLLLSAGVLTSEAFARCVGSLSIEGPGTGVFVYEPAGDGFTLRRRFSDTFEARIGTDAALERHVFELTADGQASFAGREHAARITLRAPVGPASRPLERVSWPRGLYDLQVIGGRLRVDMPEAPAGTFVSLGVSPDSTSSCLLLIAHASETRLEGSVLLRHAIRPLAPLPVPQTGLPLRFTFKLTRP